ncbi:DEAD/DEAH box type DNA/RNA helicase protein (plasmid) [Rhizobium sp. CIAT894]|uniref:DEAD/DEAH box helicase n=1 Tax=Rhizobium sp. CIAT894 TaxID=2020312 RepID=UPI000A1DA146|nr:DEAD/DEAH box helicase family protein [Rhizobium sp. CIAT894]ARM91059.1 DEAD/DEAH box type DNA/RNA helicase protein [Rhizobium sp. CIAT894]
MPNFFRDHSGALALRPLGAPNSGFRPGQLGALHSVVSHFSVFDEPAIVSLPTGYGKTAVIMALPFVLGAQRLLVVEPTDVLRRQTAAHFGALSTLRKLRVLAEGIADPLVKGQKGRPATDAEWHALEEYDVVVSTPSSTSPVNEPHSSADLFDLVLFDEAHHAPADTWKAYLRHYPRARFVFLTATPFRRDKKTIPGRLAYSYPVSKASREQAFGKVSFRPAVVRNDQDEDEIDRSIARAAIEQLRTDRQAGFDHRLFARASSIAAARNLVQIYTGLGAQVAAIDSSISKRRQDQVEEALLGGQLDGVVCVDMFGEGYDFPKLKIAALHAPHRSLVPTLQFIGRFARTNGENTGDATLIAPISRLREATSRLFQEGVDVAQLIDEAAQQQIADRAVDREILAILKTKVQAESDYDAVSPLSLKLYAHARIFECDQQPDFNLFGSIVGRKLKLAKQWISEDGLITLLLTVDHEPPNWAISDVLVNVRHDVFLLAYNVATRLCFIGSTRRTDRLYIDMMQTIVADRHRPLSFEATLRARAGLTDMRFYSVGLRNTAINSQAESYRMLTGPRAERAVTPGDGRAYVQGHYFGSGIEDGERETIGASSNSRIWSNQRLTVSEYLDWITKLNGRLNGDDTIAQSQLDLVQHSRTLKRLPALVIGGSWHKTAYRQAPRVRYRRVDHAQWTYAQITDLELGAFAIQGQELSFDVVSEQHQLPFLFSVAGGQLIRQRGAGWEIELGSSHDDWLELGIWLSIHPPVFYAADKSSFEGMNAFPPPALVATGLLDEDVENPGWDGCEISREFDGADAGRMTVHRHLEGLLRAKRELEVLVYDHRTGEAADLIAITQEPEDRFRVSLYHCKGAGGEPSGTRVNDVYEVTCQLLKSVVYCDPNTLTAHIEHRINPGRHQNPSRFLVGTIERAKEILLNHPADRIEFAIYGVQPGISKAAIDEHLTDLMAFSLDYVRRGGAAVGKWLVNA